ncbi:MAG: CatB-related O-acetyltransferase [Massiliimalia sp.]
MRNIPDPNEVFPNEYGTSCFLKNVVSAPNIFIGDYTYYDDPVDPTAFEKNNVLFNWPEFGDRLVIGKFCSIASGVKFIMGPANHRMTSVSTYPFAVFGEEWSQKVPPHLEQLPRKGDIIVGNDVWFGRESVIMPGVTIGNGAIIGAYSVVAKDVAPYSVVAGNPARLIRKRFDDELIQMLQEFCWWDYPIEEITEFLPLLCEENLERVKQVLSQHLKQRT